MYNKDRIQPYSLNSSYWQYKGKPVLLLGGSKTDHIFLLNDLKEHLNEIKEAGGNYVRNTMSQRENKELKPYNLLANGKFDLTQWNKDYWTRFERMLNLSSEQEIFVQIEVWDRFDYSTENWQHSPWNPANNVNYAYEETGFKREYPLHPSRDVHPFFHTIKGMKEYKKKYNLIRQFQESFVEKMLSYSLQYGHVLYCMNNETSTKPEWGRYWIQFINEKASKQGINVYTTDMFDDVFKAEESEYIKVVFDYPEVYTFADISQVNSRNFGEVHWEKMQWLVKKVNEHPRPVNNVKIYGSGYTSWGSGGPEDGVERFWRNIIGGCASARFHRPGAGNGLNLVAINSIKTACKLESMIKMWDLQPQMHLLSDRDKNEAYVAAKIGEQYVLYFTDGGSVGLDLSAYNITYKLRWISVSTGEWQGEEALAGGCIVSISAPDKGGWVAAIVRE